MVDSFELGLRRARARAGLGLDAWQRRIVVGLLSPHPLLRESVTQFSRDLNPLRDLIYVGR